MLFNLLCIRVLFSLYVYIVTVCSNKSFKGRSQQNESSNINKLDDLIQKIKTKIENNQYNEEFMNILKAFSDQIENNKHILEEKKIDSIVLNRKRMKKDTFIEDLKRILDYNEKNWNESIEEIHHKYHMDAEILQKNKSVNENNAINKETIKSILFVIEKIQQSRKYFEFCNKILVNKNEQNFTLSDASHSNLEHISNNVVEAIDTNYSKQNTKSKNKEDEVTRFKRTSNEYFHYLSIIISEIQCTFHEIQTNDKLFKLINSKYGNENNISLAEQKNIGDEISVDRSKILNQNIEDEPLEESEDEYLFDHSIYLPFPTNSENKHLSLNNSWNNAQHHIEPIFDISSQNNEEEGQKIISQVVSAENDKINDIGKIKKERRIFFICTCCFGTTSLILGSILIYILIKN